MLPKLLYLFSLTELTGSGGEQLFLEADNEITNNFTTTADNNYLGISPITIASGTTVTVTNNSSINFL
jgi:hypothetical protein|tara:strand:+ start:532 stop:735 length:204 start_codon:yes stop_codon:yes gene_type:complete